MICQNCNKNKASVYYNENINGEKVEKYLCNECAKELTNADFEFSVPFSMMDVISKLGFCQEEDTSKLVCPTCEMTYSEFKNTGRFGCSDCYKAFGSKVNPMLQNIHGHIEHVGKAPKKSYNNINILNEIKKARFELDMAIKDEEYEHAAELRDKIKSLEESLD